MEYRVEFSQQSNSFGQQKRKKQGPFNGQQPHGGRYCRRGRGCCREPEVISEYKA